MRCKGGGQGSGGIPVMNLGLVLGEGFILRHLVGGFGVVGQGVPRHGEEVGGGGGDA